MGERTVYGIQAVTQLLLRNPDRVIAVYLQEDLGRDRFARLDAPLAASGVESRVASREHLEQLTGTSKHQGAAALIAPPEPLNEGSARDFVERLDRPLLLVLDGIQDPRNFGACLRTAEAAGVDLVVTARNRNVGFTPAVSKVAAGAAELQAVAVVGNLVRFLQALKKQGLWVVGADERAEDSVFAADLDRPIALVFGSEGRGLRRLTRETCDLLVGLPMLGHVESLNISVAAGICLYECQRQRRALLASAQRLR